MDTGLTGKQALVCGASKGLGRACAEALAAEGVHLTLVARSAAPLAEAASMLRQRYGVDVHEVAVDITTPAGIDAALAACPAPDILVTNAGGPPPGNFRDWSREDWHKAVDANMLTPIELIKGVVDGMISRRFGRIVNITSGAVKAPIAVLGLSNGARSGLTGFVAGLARDVIQHNVTVNNLLPGPFETDRLVQVFVGEAKRQGISPEQAREKRLTSHPARRFGEPAEFGAACAFLCSVQAGYITGQNLLMDGGAYPGTF
ncbi:3-oxoacyl-ACP reductase [Pokkaliibacter plantistimulans]|uniref:3-oxoacyl-ACP reductase n=1 Tax=Pokkaliibacter plantistimulans TaxID=1635171 RepID=A0ABX5M229_9GAMM|nr:MULTISPECIES: SDR family oxidoreductase [Pokkaliibacter]MDH2433846.1 SDR family oxidoreductase [Pokkaliibacter sp. MBI-7]PXF32981.1 3-oxoacyl-ACP reductase [Pokkaliibacter plantistimulans]